MAKNGVYGIKSFSFADCVDNGGYPNSFTNTIKANVTSSLRLKEQETQNKKEENKE